MNQNRQDAKYATCSRYECRIEREMTPTLFVHLAILASWRFRSFDSRAIRANSYSFLLNDLLGDPMQFHHTELDNGLTVIAELNPDAQSVAAGYFVKTGSRDETPEVSGVSHFLEHMAFKGDERYTAEDVNRIFDELGARYNASTSEEITTYYAAVLPEYLPKTLEMLSGLIRPSLRVEDFDLEKNVILEEIGMYDDQPSFLAYDKAMSAHFAGHPLGNSILGSVDSISGLSSEQMRSYHAERYRAGNLIFADRGQCVVGRRPATRGRARRQLASRIARSKSL